MLEDIDEVAAMYVLTLQWPRFNLAVLVFDRVGCTSFIIILEYPTVGAILYLCMFLGLSYNH